MLTDLRYGFRHLLKHPAFTIVAVLTLALGIGANTAIFSVVRAVLLRSLPYPESERLYQLAETRPAFGEMSISFPNYFDWRAAQQSFDDLSVYRRDDFNLTGNGEAETLHGVFVTASFFKVIGLPPKLGRVFSERDDDAGGANVVVLSEGLWHRRFGADPRVIGQVVTLNFIRYEIIGVMPAALSNPRGVDLYAPFGYYAGVPYRTERGSHPGLFGIARLKHGVSLAQAQAEFAVICAGLAEQYPASNAGMGVRFAQLLEKEVGDYRKTLWLLLGAVACVLLIACANLASLQLARATGRQKEIALRAALGASRGRLLTQLLTESVLLALIGGGIGILLAVWGVAAMRVLGPQEIPRFQQVRIDGAVLAFSALVSLGGGLLFGFFPAWKISRADLNVMLQETGRGGTAGPGRQRSQALLIVGQVALACVLLTGAGLLLQSFAALQKVRLGFDPNHVLTMEMKLPGLKYRDNPNASAEMAALHRQLLARIAALPDVTSAALNDNAPFGNNGGAQNSFAITGRPEPKSGEEKFAEWQGVSPDYFKTMGVSLMRGRAFDERDSVDNPKVVIVDDAFAHRFFPGQNPLGRQIHSLADGRPRTQFTIVGVVPTMLHEDVAAAPKLVQVYFPLAQFPDLQTTLLVRSESDPRSLSRAVRDAVVAIDPNQPISDARPMSDRLAQSLATRRLSMILVTLFSGLALGLAVLGIYGTLAYTAVQRTREMGIRLALGAERTEVLRLILGRGMLLVAAGLVAGIAASLMLGPLVASLLYGVGAHDPLTLLASAVVLAFAALVACFIPARRASRVNPIEALRAE